MVNLQRDISMLKTEQIVWEGMKHVYFSCFHDTWVVISFNFFFVVKSIFKKIKPTTFIGLPLGIFQKIVKEIDFL